MEFRISFSLISDIYLFVLAFMQCSSVFSTNQVAGPSDQPEAYFNGSSYIRLQTTINLKKHTAFSFKSCTGGELFSQIHNDNIISVSLIPTTLILSVSPSNIPKHDTTIPGDYLDNRWHTVQLLYRLGNLTLHVDDEVPRLIANATYHNEVLTSAGLYNDGAVLIVGNHYVGCMMEGPSLVFDNSVGYGHNVVFGPCPIPDDSCIVKQELILSPSSASTSGSSLSRADFCMTEPCMRHGTCINSLTSYTCVCAPRYTGKNCEFDLGNPCDKKQPPVCKNGGVCTDDPTGNYRCTCLPGFSGKGCEIEVVIDKLCVPNPCQSVLILRFKKAYRDQTIPPPQYFSSKNHWAKP